MVNTGPTNACDLHGVCSMDTACPMFTDCQHIESLSSEIEYPGLPTTADLDIRSSDFLYTFPHNWKSKTEENLEYLSIPKNEIPEFARRFIDAIETQETTKWCACTWRIHPDDGLKEPSKQRKVRIDANEWCVLHTKVGLILGFFAFVFGGEEANTPIRVAPAGAEPKPPKELTCNGLRDCEAHPEGMPLGRNLRTLDGRCVHCEEPWPCLCEKLHKELIYGDD